MSTDEIAKLKLEISCIKSDIKDLQIMLDSLASHSDCNLDELRNKLNATNKMIPAFQKFIQANLSNLDAIEHFKVSINEKLDRLLD